MSAPLLSEDRILYEDNHLLIVNKAAGWPSQGDESGDRNVVDMSKAFLKEKYQKPGNVFAGLVHRLDRPVSGVLVIAKTSKGLARMTRLFHDREVKKYYLALTRGRLPKEEGTLSHYLIKDRQKNKSKALDKEAKGSKKAVLEYSLLGQAGDHFLYSILPLTGRSHQIRVQLAKSGAVIAGDLKYGAKEALPDKSIALHAHRLEFLHPIKKEPVKITAPLPPNSIWLSASDLVR